MQYLILSVFLAAGATFLIATGRQPLLPILPILLFGLAAVSLVMGVFEGFRCPAHEDISRLAEQKWRQAGCPAGRDEEFWLAAEKELQ